jgi:uncharacterized membrane protein YeaQ/YmgE (transglycosylase-associated protein family)
VLVADDGLCSYVPLALFTQRLTRYVLVIGRTQIHGKDDPARVTGEVHNFLALSAERKRRMVMNFIIWLIVGGLLGWIASKIMHPDAQQGIVLNIIVGVVGALLAGLLLTPLFGVGTINQSSFSLPSLFISLLGAIILLAIVNLVRRGTVR